MLKLTNQKNNPYFNKDQNKASLCNKFVGRGCKGSSTYNYAIDCEPYTNCGNYIDTDVVFISSNGARKGALLPDFDEILLIINAKSTIIIDDTYTRNRLYNTGERLVEDYLLDHGYIGEDLQYNNHGFSMWKPNTTKLENLNDIT